MKRARVTSPVGLKIIRDGSSYEIRAPFDVWDSHVDGERRWCAEFRDNPNSVKITLDGTGWRSSAVLG
jgi:hypothetical protein